MHRSTRLKITNCELNCMVNELLYPLKSMGAFTYTEIMGITNTTKMMKSKIAKNIFKDFFIILKFIRYGKISGSRRNCNREIRRIVGDCRSILCLSEIFKPGKLLLKSSRSLVTHHTIFVK